MADQKWRGNVNVTQQVDELTGEPKDTFVKINSENAKLASKDPTDTPVSTTSRTASTCAPDCPFIKSPEDHSDVQGVPICYANERIRRPSIFETVERSKNATTVKNAMKILAAQTAPNSKVRHLVSGDVLGTGSQDYIEAANELHSIRKDLVGWGYTHNWRNLNSDAAKNWVLNASTETKEEAEEAIGKGWQAVITSPPGESLATSDTGERVAGRRVVTCPNQIHHEIKCAHCNLCSSNSPNRPIVQFIAHGNAKETRNLVEQAIMAKRNPQMGDEPKAEDAVETPEAKADSNWVDLPMPTVRNMTQHFKEGFSGA